MFLSIRLSALITIACFPLYATEITLSASEPADPVSFTIQNDHSVTVTVQLSKMAVNDLVHEGDHYQILGLEGFHNSAETGHPQLPFRGFNLLTDKAPDVKITILESETVSLNNYRIYPFPKPAPDVAGSRQPPVFAKNSAIYASDAWLPASPLSYVETGVIRGVPVSNFRISPVLYNPARSGLLIYTKIVARIDYAKAPQVCFNGLGATTRSLLKNISVNPDGLAKTALSLAADKQTALIVTTNEFQPAAETLAVWQRMKGYGTTVASRASWTAADVKTFVKTSYSAAVTLKPGYLLIIGDMDDVPAETFKDTEEANSRIPDFVTDLYYSCMDSASDYKPELARGRISVNSLTQAINVVRKIIKYEKDPPAQASFYTSALACAYFQDNGEDSMTGYEDRRFVQCVEDIRQYLAPKGYNSTRIYFAETATNPLYWNKTIYSFGDTIPFALRKPQFAWKGSYTDIVSGINSGCFLVYHYDHGFEQGWGDPAFSTSNLRLLTNSDLLPVIYSIDCLVGRLDFDSCFAEAVTRKPNGGAVGIVAASHLTYSGYNDAFLYGLIDAPWPGLVLKTPSRPNPVVVSHEPIYTIGDIVDQALFRMSETWNSRLTKKHHEIYYYFGDPTMNLWTKLPQTIFVTHADMISSNSVSLALGGMNISSGYATILNNTTKKTIGKAAIIGTTATIPISSPIPPDGVTLTITAQDYRPYIKNIGVSLASNLESADQVTGLPAIVARKSAFVFKPGDRQGSVAVYDINGKKIVKISRENRQPVVVDFDKLGIPNGHYVVRCLKGNMEIVKEITLIR